MDVRVDSSWTGELEDEFSSPYFAALCGFVDGEYAKGACYPPQELIFEAFNRTAFDKVKVVIVGQDPYHGPGQAHGLCFSVRRGVPPPPSLVNIYKELESEYGVAIDKTDGDLSRWADGGVLLLNATLTVAAGRPASHSGRGWERFTDAVISALDRKRDHLVFMLWGAPARRKGAAIDRSRHLVLESTHPSPLSAYRGFFGCGHFKSADRYLEMHGIGPVDWIGRGRSFSRPSPIV